MLLSQQPADYPCGTAADSSTLRIITGICAGPTSLSSSDSDFNAQVQQDELEIQLLKEQVASATALPVAGAAGTKDPAASAGSALSLLQRSFSDVAPAAAAAPGTVTCPELPQV